MRPESGPSELPPWVRSGPTRGSPLRPLLTHLCRRERPLLGARLSCRSTGIEGGWLTAAILIAIQSVREILTPHHLPHWSTLIVLILVVAIKEGMARWVGHAGEKNESTSLQADAWHHRSDALTSLAAFVGISIGLIGGKGFEPADDYAALAACLVILFSGIRLLVIAVGDLLDIAPSKDFEEKVRKLASEVTGVKAVEKCRIRKSGTAYFVEIHLQVDGNASVKEGHQIGGKVRAMLRQSNLRIADVHIHIEPFADAAIA